MHRSRGFIYTKTDSQNHTFIASLYNEHIQSTEKKKKSRFPNITGMAIINKWVENISHPRQTMLQSELRAWLQSFPGCIPYYCNEGIPQQLLQEAQDGRIEELKNTHKHHLHGQYQVM